MDAGTKFVMAVSPAVEPESLPELRDFALRRAPLPVAVVLLGFGIRREDLWAAEHAGEVEIGAGTPHGRIARLMLNEAFLDRVLYLHGRAVRLVLEGEDDVDR